MGLINQFAAAKSARVEMQQMARNEYARQSAINISKMEMRSARLVCSMLVAGLAWIGQEVSANAADVKASFGMSIAGIPVGKGGVSATIKGRNYTIDGFAKTSGVSRMFIDSKGRAVSKGRFRGDKLMPSSYALNSKENKIRNVVQIAMRSGNVKDFSASPPPSKVSDRIPLKRVHTRGIVDPLSGLLLSTKSLKDRVGKSVCNRTVRMFDGRWRYNIELYYKGKQDVRASNKKGYTGPVTKCGARLRFVAGHRPNKKSTKFMERNKDLEVWFVPVGNEPVVAVYRLQIGTMVGRLVLQARNWQVN
ncbi:DUF3108 domain-containing protein [Cohaesibacter gelatinilyticus]|nr:DUF3108 domain-containing protein [Cohaesibacter gelatinilyticus]HAT86762.1 DUF3108 domain-containing protein [Hyphomicrobiales bacterium]